MELFVIPISTVSSIPREIPMTGFLFHQVPGNGSGGHRPIVKPLKSTAPREGGCTSTRSSGWSVTTVIRFPRIAYPRAWYRFRSATRPGASMYSNRSVMPSSTGWPSPAKSRTVSPTSASFSTICNARRVAPSKTNKFTIGWKGPKKENSRMIFRDVNESFNNPNASIEP